MKRYYLGRRVGSGTSLDPYNSELRAWLREHHPAAPKHLQQIIAHVSPVVLHKYDLDDATHAAVMAGVPQVFAFPEGALDRLVSSIPVATRTAIRDRLVSLGFSFSWVTAATTVRDVLAYVAHSIQLAEWADVSVGATTFDTVRTVGDVPISARQRIADRLRDLGVDLSAYTLTTPLRTVIADLQRLRFSRLRRRWLYHDEEAE